MIGAVLKKATGTPSTTPSCSRRSGSPMSSGTGANGDPIAAGLLRLGPRDLAKIGQLVLQHGAWNGTRVLPASSIEAATTPQINVSGFASVFYGYFFWLGRSLVDRREVQWVAAVGLGGQRVFIVPALDLVVVVNAGLYKSSLQLTVPGRHPQSVCAESRRLAIDQRAILEERIGPGEIPDHCRMRDDAGLRPPEMKLIARRLHHECGRPVGP